MSPIATSHRASLLKSIFALFALLISLPAAAAQLTIELDHASKTWQTADLLKHPDVQTVQIVDDVSYKRTMTYRAVPLAALLPGLKPENHLQAIALDGFAAELTAAPLAITRKGGERCVTVMCKTQDRTAGEIFAELPFLDA